MKATHRCQGTEEDNPDSVRVERADDGRIVLTINQPSPKGLNKRTVLIMSHSTFRLMCGTAVTFHNNEGDFALPEDQEVEF